MSARDLIFRVRKMEARAGRGLAYGEAPTTLKPVDLRPSVRVYDPDWERRTVNWLDDPRYLAQPWLIPKHCRVGLNLSKTRRLHLEYRQDHLRERLCQAPSTTFTAPTERHFTVPEVAAMWKLSTDSVRRLFQNEPGVLRLGRDHKGTRQYVTLRIPESVFQRVYRRLLNT